MNTLHRCKTNSVRISRRAIDVIRLAKYIGWLLVVLIFIYGIARGDNYNLVPNPDIPIVRTNNTVEHIGAKDPVYVPTFVDSAIDARTHTEEKEHFKSFNMLIDPPQHNHLIEEGFLRFELSTRKETRLEIPKNNPEILDHSLSWCESAFDSPVLSRDPDVTMASDYGELHRVVNPAQWPWWVSCKLRMKFPNGARYSGSGILIDSKFVLTAAHCIYSQEDGGYVEEISVTPGYLDGEKPFGSAEGLCIYVSSSWKSDEDFNYDYGYVKLQRPIGALTGWAEPSYKNDSYFLSETFANSGYPGAEYYDGEKLYVRYGTYDDVKTNKLVANSRGYGGLSGGGCYTYTGQGMFVYGVHSYTGTSTGYSYANRLTSSKVSNISNSIASVTPQSYDLIPLSVQTRLSRIDAGKRLSEVKYLIHNYSSDRVSGIVKVKVYLSENDNITENDMLLQSHDVDIDILPKKSTWISISGGLMIPFTLQPGKYYIGVILDANDSRTTNNDSDGYDAAEIRIDLNDAVSIIGDPSLPEEFILKPNYPNPFNPSTTIDFYIPKSSHVKITVYNLLGEEVCVLEDDRYSAGMWSACWDGTNNNGNQVSSGVYLYRLETEGFNTMRKMLLLK